MRFVLLATVCLLSVPAFASECDRLFEDEPTRAKCNTVRDTSFYWTDEKLRAAVESVKSTETQCRRLFTGESLALCLAEAGRTSSPVADDILEGSVKRLLDAADLERRKAAAKQKLATIAKSSDLRLKGLFPGMTLDEADTLYPGIKKYCAAVAAPQAEFSCHLDSKYFATGFDNEAFQTIAEHKVQIWMAHGSGNRIWHLSILIDSDSANEIGDQLARKYPGSTVSMPIVTNRMNAKFQNKIRLWRRGDLILEVDRYGVDLSTGTVSFASLKRPAKPQKPVGKDL